MGFKIPKPPRTEPQHLGFVRTSSLCRALTYHTQSPGFDPQLHKERNKTELSRTGTQPASWADLWLPRSSCCPRPSTSCENTSYLFSNWIAHLLVCVKIYLPKKVIAGDLKQKHTRGPCLSVPLEKELGSRADISKGYFV